MAGMKGIKMCGECGNYDWKKHKCKMGCNDDSDAQASFYGDCPLPDVAPKSEVIKEFVKRFEGYIGNCTFSMGQANDIQYALKKATEEMEGGEE